MGNQVQHLKKTWLGMDTRETKRYLRRLEAMMHEDAERLEDQIRQEKTVRERLLRELEQRKAKRNPENRAIEPELLEWVRSRLERSVEAVRRQGELERNSLLELLRRREKEQSRELEQARAQMEQTGDKVEQMVAETLRLIDSLKSYSGKLPLQEDDIRSALSVLAEPLAPHDYSKDRTHEPEQRQLTEDNRFQRGANVIQFRLRTFLDKLQAAEASQTANPEDGNFVAVAKEEEGSSSVSAKVAVSAGYMADSVVRPQIPLQAQSQTNRAAPTPMPVFRPLAKKKNAPSAFWGDLDDYINDESEIVGWQQVEANDYPALAPTEYTATATAQPSRKVSARAEEETAAASQPQSAPTSSKHESPPASAPTGGAARTTDAESPALAQEIRSIQQRYIAGKAAGESLYADNGALIISKGAIITPETIEAAEKAGKLADLIVQMVIPGMSEPS